MSLTVGSAEASPAELGLGGAAGRMNASGRGRLRVLRYTTILGLLVVWQLVVAVGFSHNGYIATPWAIATDGSNTLTESSTLSALGITAERYIVAFAIAAVFGVLVGTILSRVRRLTAPARDVLYLLYTLPLVPFYPLFVLWFGLGFRSEVVFGVAHGIIPIIFGTMSAAATVDETLLDSADSMGAGRLARLRLVILPSIVPGVVAALRIGASLCLIGVLIAELLISVDGVGGVIGQLSGTLQAASVDAVILAVCLAAVLVNSAIRTLERRLSRWRHA